MPSRSKLARLLRTSGTILMMGLPLGLPTLSGFGSGCDLTSHAFAQASDADESQDELTLKNGTVVKGTIVSETTTTITFKGLIGGIPLETTYQKSDVVSIKRAGKKADPATGTSAVAADAKASSTPAGDTPAAPVDPNAVKVYFIPLRGEFGQDVSQTPLLQAMRDAKAQGASVVVLEMNSTTDAPVLGLTNERLVIDNENAWHKFERAEQMFPVFNTTIPAEWNPMPRVVMVLQRATGAAAFFPFAFKEIYFAPNGVWGGIGSLSDLFSGVGDEPVQEKQKSLRLGHVEGWAIYGGYDYRLVRAMARREYVLSFKMNGGKAELLERMPTDPSEELLTDDGEKGNADTTQEFFTQTGNDVLTLNPRNALLLGVSKGTVENSDELLAALGVDRHAVVIRDRGDRIMKQWSRNMDNAKVQLTKLWEEYRQIRVEPPADYNARTKARGLQLNKLRQMKSIIGRFDEGLQEWSQQNLPGVPQIETAIKRIELEQSLDRR